MFSVDPKKLSVMDVKTLSISSDAQTLTVLPATTYEPIQLLPSTTYNPHKESSSKSERKDSMGLNATKYSKSSLPPVPAKDDKQRKVAAAA